MDGCSQHMFEAYFSSKEDYLGVVKPGISYIYVEKIHWLRRALWVTQCRIAESLFMWLPRLMEYIVIHKMNKGKFVLEDSPLEKSWQYRFWQWSDRIIHQIVYNSTLIGNWRENKIVALKPTNLKISGGKWQKGKGYEEWYYKTIHTKVWRKKLG
jgi:hypothetical protein